MRVMFVRIVAGFGAGFGDGWFESLMVDRTGPYGSAVNSQNMKK